MGCVHEDVKYDYADHNVLHIWEKKLNDGYFAYPPSGWTFPHCAPSDWTPQLLISRSSFVKKVSLRKMRSNWVHPEFSYFTPLTLTLTFTLTLLLSNCLLYYLLCSALSPTVPNYLLCPQIQIWFDTFVHRFRFDTKLAFWTFVDPVAVSPVLPFTSAWKRISWLKSICQNKK